jgi:hypothetical protein
VPTYEPGSSQVITRSRSYDGDDWYLAIGFSTAMIGTCTVTDGSFDLFLWPTMNCYRNNIFTCEMLRTDKSSKGPKDRDDVMQQPRFRVQLCLLMLVYAGCGPRE